MQQVLFFLSVAYSAAGFAQGSYAPAAGLPGSTAIFKDSAIIISWASQCEVHRGFIDIADKSLGRVNYGSTEDALGASNQGVVSLGDSGVAVLSFNGVIYDGQGPDFAIFENGFSDAYLEYAFVEASSDGTNFFRFKAYFEGDTSTQIGAYDLRGDPSVVDGLAGKYRVQWGTPFDLNDLTDTPLLQKDSVRFIRLIDVIGALDAQHAQRDALGRKINDTYPTPFATNDLYTGGFDLDAIALIHYRGEIYTGGLQVNSTHEGIHLYPNPATDLLFVKGVATNNLTLIGMDGKSHHMQVENHKVLGAVLIPRGYYAVLTMEGDFLGNVMFR
jgi:hypothetical protein